MAMEIDISNDGIKTTFMNNIFKAIQSSNLNFILGSGCSFPFIDVLGDIENKIKQKIDNDETDEVDKLLFDFLKPFANFMNNITTNKYTVEFEKVFAYHTSFILNISKILFQRKSNIIHKQASVFTTNYDLFFELASQNFSENISLFDGFCGNPVINKDIVFSISEYFNTVYNIGNLYNYQVEKPSINLIKLHGSLNWQINKGKIINSIDHFQEIINLSNSKKKEDMDKYVNSFSVILPKKDKFKETILNQVYYDLLRIFANELDKENTLLISEGFSFSDEHILEITKRGLRNPTLKLIVFCFSEDELIAFREKFETFVNVEIVYSSKKEISFHSFNNIIRDILPTYMRDLDIKNVGK